MLFRPRVAGSLFSVVHRCVAVAYCFVLAVVVYDDGMELMPTVGLSHLKWRS